MAKWTWRESLTLRELYPTWPQKDIRKALPGRGWESIMRRACRMGMKRSKRAKSAAAMTAWNRRRPDVCDDPLMKGLRNARRRLGLSTAAVSKKLNCDPQIVGKWERGTYKPPLPRLRAWCEVLGLELSLQPKFAARSPISSLSTSSR